jgi:hypothetical protein
MSVEMLTRRELSKLWKCSERHIDRLIESGELLAVKGAGANKNRFIRIPITAAEDYIEKHTLRAK